MTNARSIAQQAEDLKIQARFELQIAAEQVALSRSPLSTDDFRQQATINRNTVIQNVGAILSAQEIAEVVGLTRQRVQQITGRRQTAPPSDPETIVAQANLSSPTNDRFQDNIAQTPAALISEDHAAVSEEARLQETPEEFHARMQPAQIQADRAQLIQDLADDITQERLATPAETRIPETDV